MNAKELFEEAKICYETTGGNPPVQVVLDAELYNQALAALDKPCVWTYDEFHDMWETECGKAFCFEDGTLKDHNVNGCPNCLRPIEEKK